MQSLLANKCLCQDLVFLSSRRLVNLSSPDMFGTSPSVYSSVFILVHAYKPPRSLVYLPTVCSFVLSHLSPFPPLIFLSTSLGDSAILLTVMATLASFSQSVSQFTCALELVGRPLGCHIEHGLHNEDARWPCQNLFSRWRIKNNDVFHCLLFWFCSFTVSPVKVFMCASSTFNAVLMLLFF